MKIIITVLIFLMLGGCVSFNSSKAYLNRCDPEVYEFLLTLPTGNWFMNPHGFIWTQEIRWYLLTFKRGVKKIDYPDFAIKVNEKEIPIKSGSIVIEHKDESCILTIDLIPANSEHLVLNRTLVVKNCK